MTVVLRDAMTFLSKDIDPIVGTLSFENHFNANTTVTIKTVKLTITLLAKQIDLAIFNLNKQGFGIIFENALYYEDYENYKKECDDWNKLAKEMLGRELKPCFVNSILLRDYHINLR